LLLIRSIFDVNIQISWHFLSDAAQELAGKPTVQSSLQRPQQGLITELKGASHRNPGYGPSHYQGPAGAGPWSEVPALMPGNSLVSWAQRYERELPLRKGDRRVGTSRKWAPRSMQLREERQSNKGLSSRESLRKNIFAPLAAAFMLPIMRDYDKKAHGVDFLESGFVVLGKILYTLGVCMECITAQPEAVVLGANLLELLRSRYSHLSFTLNCVSLPRLLESFHYWRLCTRRVGLFFV
jgi:telomere length regulation protein